MRLYEEFVKETYDEKGKLTHVEFELPDNFNFAYDIVDRLAKDKPDNIAMIWLNEEGEEHIFTFADMKRESDKCAAYFKSLGIKKGDYVMLILKRHYQFWFSILAISKIGAVVVPATNQLMVKDVVYRVNAASITTIVCTADGEISDVVDEAQAKCPTLKNKIITHGDKEGWQNLDREMAKFDSFERPTGDEESKLTDIMLMYFSSGTTGMPKMVIHDHGYAMAHHMTARHWHNVGYQEPHLTVAETGWGKAVWGKLYGQWINEAIVFVYDFDRFHADALLKCIEKYQIKTFCAPPTIYRFLLLEDHSKYDLSSLRYATSAGEPLNAETIEEFKKLTGLHIKEGFGQTETTLTIYTSTTDEPKRDSMGLPSPAYDVDIVDDDGVSVAPGVVGEIVVRTDKKKPHGLFCGYYRDEEKTNQAWNNGLYHTGDMAWKDEQGYYFYMSRKDDVIKSSGYRIGPFEVESVIMEHPSVVECAVTGVPDPVRGQAIKATIVLHKGYEPSEELKKDIQEYVKSVTAPYKYPRVIDFVSELPKTISGKVRRVDLRK